MGKKYGFKIVNGKPVAVEEHTPTRAQRKSTQTLIPLTPAPKTAWQKFKRAAVG